MLVFSDKQPGDQGPVRSTWGWGGGVVGGGGDGVGGRRAAAVIETVAGGSCFAPCGSCIGPREASHDCDLTYVSAGCECASLVALAATCGFSFSWTPLQVRVTKEDIHGSYPPPGWTVSFLLPLLQQSLHVPVVGLVGLGCGQRRMHPCMHPCTPKHRCLNESPATCMCAVLMLPTPSFVQVESIKVRPQDGSL